MFLFSPDAKDPSNPRRSSRLRFGLSCSLEHRTSSRVFVPLEGYSRSTRLQGSSPFHFQFSSPFSSHEIYFVLLRKWFRRSSFTCARSLTAATRTYGSARNSRTRERIFFLSVPFLFLFFFASFLLFLYLSLSESLSLYLYTPISLRPGAQARNRQSRGRDR